MGILIGIISLFLKVLLAVMKFTGAWATVLISVIGISIENKIYPNGHEVAD